MRTQSKAIFFGSIFTNFFLFTLTIQIFRVSLTGPGWIRTLLLGLFFVTAANLLFWISLFRSRRE